MKNVLGMRDLVAVALYLALLPAAVNAYIDPGNGAYLVQALFTVLGAVVFYLRHPVRLFRALWDRLLPGRAQGSRAHLADSLPTESADSVGHEDEVEADST
jgi:hypothetical protein